MNFIEFKKLLHKHAKNLDLNDRISLSVEICKRLFPSYKKFYQTTGFGNPDCLLDIILFVESNNQDIGQIQQFLKVLTDICPDTEDFDNASYALNACAAANGLLRQLSEPSKLEHFIETAMAYYDTIDAQVQDSVEGKLNEDQVNNHPLIDDAKKFLLHSNCA